MDESFNLHERLDADCHLVTDWPLSRVLLMNDSTYPWLILVPRLAGLRDLDDLSPSRMMEAGEEIRHLSKVMKELFKPDKMNVAALGNMVPQLHIHVIARYADDPAWPGPVWGVRPPQPYEEEALAATLDALRVALV
jgi:diadenosine tetraphosphate (Ap4A) HIT family hydrolase